MANVSHSERPLVFTSAIDQDLDDNVTNYGSFKSAVQVADRDYVTKRKEKTLSDKLVIFHDTVKSNKKGSPKTIEDLKFDEFTQLNEKQFDLEEKETDNLVKESQKQEQSTFKVPQNLKEVVCPKLPFGFKDLAPVISMKQIEAHYEKHKEYVSRLNVLTRWVVKAMEENNFDKVTEFQQQIQFYGGGHKNLELFWPQLSSR